MFCAPMITLLVMLSFFLDATPVVTTNLGGKAKRGAGAAARLKSESGAAGSAAPPPSRRVGLAS